jgi:hypothetical protein
MSERRRGGGGLFLIPKLHVSQGVIYVFEMN